MKMTSDLDLLREYASGSEKAFATLVTRHLDLVYSAALRQVKSSQLAEDITQSVFTDLARNARGLKDDTVLAAWLYQVTRRTALNVSRGEARRLAREQIAVDLADMNAPSSDWTQIEPWLDEAMETLDEPDRAAILLRYFENQSLRDVGKTLGVGEDAAQKRVSRAVERLREFFSKRNVTIGASGLTVLISTNAVQAAPVGLISLISSAASLAGAAAQTSTTIAATTTIAMTTLQKTFITAAIVAATGTGIYEARQASVLRNEVQTLRQQQNPLAEQIQKLEQERASTTAKLAILQEENERLQKTVAEVPKLRGDLGRLRTTQERAVQSKNLGLDPNDPAVQSFLAAKAQAQQIGQYLEKMPDKTIPEFKLLRDLDWLAATKEASFDSDADVRKTLSKLRSLAKNRVPMGGALNAFIVANNGQLPTELSQLKPFFQSALGTTPLPPADLDAIFNRYTLLRTGAAADLPSDAWIIAEKAPVDKEYDTRAKFGNGRSTVIATGIGEAGDPDDKTY